MWILCFSSAGIGNVFSVEGKMVESQILEESLLESARVFGDVGGVSSMPHLLPKPDIVHRI